jgi:hypothetical protein
MTDEPEQPQPQPEPERKSGVGGPIVVIGILLIIAAGTGAWFLMDHGGDMLSKTTGTEFAAAFEKECQPNHGKEICRSVAGQNHARCLRDAASTNDSGIVYEEITYLACMRAALDTRVAPK